MRCVFPADELQIGPPIKGTLVVAIGQGLEALTGGVTQSTTHRVLSPQAGTGPRFSIPFFQGVSYDAKFESMDVPEHVRKLRDEILQQNDGRKDDVEFTFVKGKWNHLGEATLMNRIKSHPDVGERWYPDLLQQVREEQRRAAEEAAGGTKAKQSEEEKLMPNSGTAEQQHEQPAAAAQAIEAH